jgi:hypothetical protein
MSGTATISRPASVTEIDVRDIWLRIYHRRLNHLMMPKHSAGIHSSGLPLGDSEKPVDSFCTVGCYSAKRTSGLA